MREAVRTRYTAAAAAVTRANPSSADAALPSTAVLASLGCGNPTALAELKPGETVGLDSNCVINLSADKRQVLRGAFRVPRPGGRFAVADVVVQGELPAE